MHVFFAGPPWLLMTWCLGEAARDLLGDVDRSMENRTEGDIEEDLKTLTRVGEDDRWLKKEEEGGEWKLELVEEAKADAVAESEDSGAARGE